MRLKSKYDFLVNRKKGHRTKHFKNADFLITLGKHCQKIRSSRGYSIDRLAKESDQLSPSVIHRLENGLGSVTVSAFYRYANALGVGLRDLMDFPYKSLGAPAKITVKRVRLDDSKVKKEAFKTLLPLYNIRAAAGYFGVGTTAEPEAWIEIEGSKKLDSKMFVVVAVGDSMLPKIKSGDHLVFRAQPDGSKQGKIVLAQYRGPADPDTGGSYTVKQYSSSKLASSEGEWPHKQVILSPLNPDYEPILLYPKQENDFRIIAEYLYTI